MLNRFATPEADAFARSFITQVRAGDPAAARHLTPDLLRVPAMKDSLRALTRFFPGGPVQEMTLLNAQVFMTAEATSRTLLYEQRSAAGLALVEVVVVEDAQKYRYIAGIRVQPTQAPLQTVNAFTLADRGVTHWTMLLLAIAVPLFCLWAAVRVIRTPMPRRWGWAFLAVLAGGQATLNWTTGELFVNLIHLQLLGSGVQRSGMAGPWMLTVAMPLGAMMALLRRRRFLAQATDVTTAGVASTDPLPEGAA
ncbi:MAG TPA: MerC domain-containing protein [Longimicrobium sp.]